MEYVSPKLRFLNWFLASAALILFFPLVAQADDLQMIVTQVDSRANVNRLVDMGLDVTAVRQIEGKSGFRVELVVNKGELKKLENMGFRVNAVRSRQGARSSPRARAGDDGAGDSEYGFAVYRSFDETGGMRDRIEQVALDYPEIARLETFGDSLQDRPLYAVKLGSTKRFRKPEMLIVSTHHAREWIAAEMGIRLLEYLAQGYGTDERITSLLDRVNVWLVPIGNPDGYEFTFTNERLWRKNLRDNNDDGTIDTADGVDLNRNFGGRWGLDDEGSSGDPASAVYRGPAPFSEPESAAIRDFIQAHKFKYLVNYHSYGNLILYPLGWQVKTPSPDDPIFVAHSGTDDDPAIVDSLLGRGYDPGVGADLYITNGDFTEWTYGSLRIPSYTLELTAGEDETGEVYGFEFPDDEDMVQTVFEDNLEFALSVAESAADPANPVSPVGITTEDAYHTPLTSSRGLRQLVTITARKTAPMKVLRYRVDDGPEHGDWFRLQRGKFYNKGAGVHFSHYQARIRRQKPGSVITYTIEVGDTVLGPFTYTVEAGGRAPVLVVAAEDYDGPLPSYADNGLSDSEPNYLSYYTDALDALNVRYDTWDVDSNGVPPVAEVLSHYKAVVWYSGDDFAPADFSAEDPGFVVRDDEFEAQYLNIRDYLNYYRGKTLATGQALSALSTVFFFGDLSDDFFQYYLGEYLHGDGGGMDAEANDGDGAPFPIVGEPGDPVFDGLSFALEGGNGANNQVRSTSFLTTSQFLDGFSNERAAQYDRPTGSLFGPQSGEYYVYSQQGDYTYKRLGGVFTLPAAEPELSFAASYDIEADWDYAFVEIRETGTDAWTTLPERSGRTGTETGESCRAGWVEELHPHLAFYMDAECNSTGSTGEWHALDGRSGGFRQLSFDLSAYAGKEVELYIAYASDWGTQGLGMFVDDVEISGADAQDFETDLGQWQPAPPPEGSAEGNNWERTLGAAYIDASAIRTDYSVYLGFGFEAVDTDANRTELMSRIMTYFGIR